MTDIVEDHDNNQFAKGQSCRDLRVSPEPGMANRSNRQYIGDLLRFVEF
jgi:hypothetical protein